MQRVSISNDLVRALIMMVIFWMRKDMLWGKVKAAGVKPWGCVLGQLSCQQPNI